MDTIISLLKLWHKDVYSYDGWWDETYVNYIKDNVIVKAKEFLQWLIDNWHIEEIKSDKKTWADLNDYIKYIASSDDPIKTLSEMIK